MNTILSIEFIDEQLELIHHFEAPCNPYKVGDLIHLSVDVHSKGFWNVNDLRQSYRIVDIEHFVRASYYGSTFKEAKSSVIMTVSIKLVKNDKIDN